MKKIFFSLLFTCILTCAFAQKVDTIEVISNKQVVILANYTISSQTKIEEVIKLLGTPSRIEKVADVDRHYVYDQLGLSFDAGKNNLVEAVTVNYNWDKDKKAAQETYKGILIMDNYTINSTTKADDIKSKTNVKDIICMGPTMCMSKPTTTTLAIIIGYNEAANISQIVFGFTQ